MYLPPGDAEPIHQGVHPIERVMLGLVGQMGVSGGGEYGVMAEEFLDLDQIDAGLDQVSCIAVAPMSPAT